MSGAIRKMLKNDFVVRIECLRILQKFKGMKIVKL